MYLLVNCMINANGIGSCAMPHVFMRPGRDYQKHHRCSSYNLSAFRMSGSQQRILANTCGSTPIHNLTQLRRHRNDIMGRPISAFDGDCMPNQCAKNTHVTFARKRARDRQTDRRMDRQSEIFI